MGAIVVIREEYGNNNLRRQYIKSPDEAGPLLTVDKSKRLSSFTQFFKTVFLPQGYPDSVSEDYMEYQIWDTIQAFCSSITGTLATQGVLQGVGVGDESATVLAATITWLMKDGTGMLGRIGFAWMKGLFADILNDGAICLEIMAPFFKEYFRYIICISGVAKSIVGVAGGATRAALTQHQARRNNLADVSAKDGSQETLVNLAALLCSLTLVHFVTGNFGFIWTLFFLFTSLHLFANYRAVRSVTMETFNESRLHFVCHHYFGSGQSSVLPVAAVNRMEPVVWSLQRCLHIKLGSPAASVVNSFDELTQLSSLYKDENYILNINVKKGRVSVVFNKDASTKDYLKASIQAEILEYAFSSNANPGGDLSMNNVIEALKQGDQLSMMVHSLRLMNLVFSPLKKLANASGWMTENALLCVDEWRAEWNTCGFNDKKVR